MKDGEVGVHPAARIHPTAVVDPGAVVGADTTVWHFCHLMPGARVGARCVLGQNVFVGGAVVVGDGCRIQNNVSLYDGVLLDEEVFVGPSAVFTNVTTPRAFLSRKDVFQETRVARGATIGANATVICGRQLGAYSFVAAGAVVTHDVPAYALMVGAPARQAGWVCHCGERLAPFAGAKAEWRCVATACGARFMSVAGLSPPGTSGDGVFDEHIAPWSE